MSVESIGFKKDSKKNPKKLKRAITLIEMIVVLMILTMITGALAYNYKKSIDEGKKFKAREMASRVRTVLEIAIAEGRATITNVNDIWKDEVKTSPLIQDSAKFTTDADAIKLTVIPGNPTATDPVPFTITHMHS